MSDSIGSNFNLVKIHNVQAIVLTLLRAGQLSRVELAKETGLSTTTITNLTSELIANGIITEQGAEATTELRKVGRPRTMLRIIPRARYTIGVHIGVGLFRAAITDLHAEIIDSELHAFELAQPAEQVVDQIALTIKLLIARNDVKRERILAVGVGASGLVDHETGVNVFAPRLQWREIAIRARLEQALDFPVVVENNVRSMALAESLFGLGQGVDILAFVYGRVGVGAGFILKGNIFRGGGAGVGEMGHTTIICQSGERCSCGNTGCLETLVSEPALLRKAQEHLDNDPGSLLYKKIQERKIPLSAELVFEAARAGDEVMQAEIREQAYYLGVALANLVNVLNPELIILGGIFAQGHDLYLPAVTRTVRDCAFGGLGKNLRLEVTSFGWRAGVVGAASLALSSAFYHAEEAA
jgi:N-acetylglucosamine repressor